MSVLDLPMQENDANAKTIREYLITLLLRLWEQGEGFSGKRPFGMSSWEHDLYKPLAKAGLIEGTYDDDGYLETVDYAAGDALIAAAISELK